MRGLARKFVSKAGGFSRCRRAPPVRRKVIYSDALARQILRDLGGHQNQIRRRVGGVKVNKILQHRQRLMFGSVSKTSPGVRPSATVAISSFTIERRPGVGLAQYAIDLPHLDPP